MGNPAAEKLDHRGFEALATSVNVTARQHEVRGLAVQGFPQLGPVLELIGSEGHTDQNPFSG